MKWKIGLIVLVVLAALLPSAVLAADPPEYHFGMVQCSGLSLVELGIANQKFDSAYGWQHQLTTEAQWVGSYAARVEMFASTVGCPRVFTDNSQLTLHYKLFGFWYRFYLSDIGPVELAKQINQ